ncbi:hypothetical protein KY331_00150 [Candidatus Woesearchaeota archaeon]|nr:hypothetical protein [Candidatus Woesearchaeota archaeon]
MRKLILFLFIILFLVGCKAPEEPTVTTPTETLPEGPIGEASEVSVPSEPTKTVTISATGEALSQVKCVGTKIEGIVTNVADTQIDITKEASAVIHGVLVVHPTLMECEKTILEPGESTYCGSLAGKYKLAEENRLIFRMTGLEKGIAKTVECPQS